MGRIADRFRRANRARLARQLHGLRYAFVIAVQETDGTIRPLPVLSITYEEASDAVVFLTARGSR